MDLVLYHNPRCSKSRATLALLEERGLAPEIVDYLKEPPDVDRVRALLDMLDVPPRDAIRRGESEFAAIGLSAEENDPDAIAAAIAAAPKLLQRPILVANGRARIGRPPEHVLDIL